MTMMKQDSGGDGTAIFLMRIVLLHRNHTSLNCVMISESMQQCLQALENQEFITADIFAIFLSYY